MTSLKNDNESQFAIVGAGISGMAAAWEFAKAGISVDVYERDVLPGGLAGWFEVGGTTLEKFYHHLYNLDKDLIQIIQEMGLGNQLVFKATVTGCFYVNRIYRLSSPMDLLKYKPLKFIDRIRLGLMALKARYVKDWHELDNITAKDWVIKMAGKQVYEVLWEPLFRSKFGQYAPEVSAAWLWSKLVQRGGSRGKSGAEELGYLQGGYGDLFRKLQEKITESGSHLYLNSKIEEIVIEDEKVIGIRQNGQLKPYKAVLAACQLPDFLKVADNLPLDYKNKLKDIGFLGNNCLVLKLNKRLSDTYWVNITDTTCPFVGVIEQTNLLSEQEYAGFHMAYLSRYMDVSDPIYSMDAEELFQLYLPYMKKIFPAFDANWVVEKYLWREPHAQAVVSVGYGKKIPKTRSPVKGLYLTTMAQIFPEDRQMSNGVKFAKKAARMILEDFKA